MSRGSVPVFPHHLPIPRVVTEVALLVFGLGLPALVMTAQPPPTGHPANPGAVAVGVVVGVPLVLLRRWRPLELLAVAVAATVATMAVAASPTPLLGAIIILLFTVADTTGRRTEIIAGVTTVVALHLASTFILANAPTGPEALAMVAWGAMAVAIGDATRSRRQYVESVEERMRRIEEERERDAERRVVEERLRIARELHDVVAHHLAVINVQAGAAEHLVFRDPATTAQALETIRRSAATVLDELGATLHVLRSNDHDGAGREPMPTLAQLDELVDQFARAGLAVSVVSDATLDQYPEVFQLIAFRVIQEALTNAAKHGGGAAELRMIGRPEGLEVRVTNPLRSDPSSDVSTGTSLGLVGMRERVDALGGRLTHRVDGSSFVLDAVLPAPAGDVTQRASTK